MASYLLSPPPSYTSGIGSPTSPLYYEDNESSIDVQKSNDQHNTDFNFVDDNEWLLYNENSMGLILMLILWSIFNFENIIWIFLLAISCTYIRTDTCCTFRPLLRY